MKALRANSGRESDLSDFHELRRGFIPDGPNPAEHRGRKEYHIEPKTNLYILLAIALLAVVAYLAIDNNLGGWFSTPTETAMVQVNGGNGGGGGGPTDQPPPPHPPPTDGP
jgi:hypothetical protein